jgi:DNA-binding MarR family transcriptional regulator
MDADTDSVEWMRRHWVEQGQPAPEHFAAMAAVLRTHQAVVGAMDKQLRASDLSRTAYLLMTTLQMSRDRTRPLGQLSKHLIVHPTTITLVIDQLEKRGLVTRTPHPTDRRTVLATLTADGVAAVEKASAALADVGFGLGGVSPQMAITMTEILRQVREQVGDIA